MGKITIVMGIPCSGKSTYIKDTYQDREIFDLKAYQDKKTVLNVKTVLESYEECQNDFINAIKAGKDVVLEHTLLKVMRRKSYIDAIRELTDEPVELVFIDPEYDVHIKRIEEVGIPFPEDYLNEHLEILERPTLDEGFGPIVIVVEQ